MTTLIGPRGGSPTPVDIDLPVADGLCDFTKLANVDLSGADLDLFPGDPRPRAEIGPDPREGVEPARKRQRQHRAHRVRRDQHRRSACSPRRLQRLARVLRIVGEAGVLNARGGTMAAPFPAQALETIRHRFGLGCPRPRGATDPVQEQHRRAGRCRRAQAVDHGAGGQTQQVAAGLVRRRMMRESSRSELKQVAGAASSLVFWAVVAAAMAA